MSSTVNVDVAAQVALNRRLDALANNLANAGTVGFRGDGVKFDSLVSTQARPSVAYPSGGTDYVTLSAGPTQRTGNPLDFAVRGDAWMSLMSPTGQVYTRDGRVEIATTGELRSVNGYPLLDASGSPLLIDPAAGEVSVAPDGSITQRGRQVGTIGLFEFDRDARFTRFDNSSVTADREANPVTNFAAAGVMQGHLEQSNVNPVREMSRLIEIQRAFDNVTASMDMIDSSQQDAIKTLGATS